MDNVQQSSTAPKQEPKFTSKHIYIPRVLLILVLTLLSAGIFGTIGYFLGKAQQENITPVLLHTTYMYPTPTISSIKPTFIGVDPISPPKEPNWKKYTSPVEKVSFTYPSTWSQTTPSVSSNISQADTFAIQSPLGKVKLTWVSELDGFGGSCDTQLSLGIIDSCPLITVIDKIPITNAPGLFVIEGTVTRDGKNFQPWLAVQDSNGLIKSGRSADYDLFQGRNNGSTLALLNGHNTTALFSTSGAEVGGPSMSQDMANAYFTQPEVKQAELILQSLTY